MTGPDGGDGMVVDHLSPEESFELLAHESRVRTIQTLDEDGPLPHATLRERVGVDDPGRFNYHLRKLDGQFVREGDEGYDLTVSGRRVVGAVLSGGYTGDLAGEPISMDADCLRCGGSQAYHLDDDGVYVACRDCDLTFNRVEIPPGVLEGSGRGDVPDLVDRWLKRRLTTAQYGFCYRCDGSVDQRVIRVTDDGDWRDDVPGWLADLPVDVLVRHRCVRCGDERDAFVATMALFDPVVVGFHHEHGIDVRETPMVDLDWLEMGVTTVESTDPLVVTVPVTLDEETLVVSFDAGLSRIDDRRY
jgi:hypothetical protein